jgi:hypothetical protein
MKTNLIIDAFARAFGVFVFAVIVLWFSFRAFPGNWMALVVLYLICVPLAVIYGLLVGPQSNLHASPRRRVPGLLVIGIGVVLAAVGRFAYQTEIEGIFYDNR